jgi:hypothetical protein
VTCFALLRRRPGLSDIREERPGTRRVGGFALLEGVIGRDVGQLVMMVIVIAVEQLFSAGTGSSRSHGERGSPTRAGSLEPGAMVGEMTASIARELKQPLATIMSKRTLPSASIGARTQGPVGAIVLNLAVNSVDAVGGEPTERRRID